MYLFLFRDGSFQNGFWSGFSLQDNLNCFLTFLTFFNLRACMCVYVFWQHDGNFLLKKLFIRYSDCFEVLKLVKVQRVKNKRFCYTDKYLLIIYNASQFVTYKKNLCFLYRTNAGFSHISHPPSKVMCLHFHTVILVIFLYFGFTRFNQFILIQIIPFCLYNNHKINLEKLQNVKMARNTHFFVKRKRKFGSKTVIIICHLVYCIAQTFKTRNRSKRGERFQKFLFILR